MSDRSLKGYEMVASAEEEGDAAAAHGDRTQLLTAKSAAEPDDGEWGLPKTNEWYHTAALLLADIIGTGILSLPGAFAKLEYGGGIALLCITYPMNLYTGVLLARMKQWVPRARSYGDLLGEVFGPVGRIYGYM